MGAKRRRRFARRVVRKVPKAVKQYVSKALSTRQETKYKALSSAGLDIGPSASSAIPSRCFFLDPSQGTSRSNRIGNEVMPTGIKIKALVNWLNADSVQKGMVRIIVGQMIGVPNPCTVTDVENALFNNSVFTVDRTIALRDKDQSVRVLHDVLIRANNDGYQWSSGGGLSAIRAQTFCRYFKIKAGKSHVQAWTDTGDFQRNLTFIYICSNSDGSSALVRDSVIAYNMKMYYKDA